MKEIVFNLFEIPCSNCGHKLGWHNAKLKSDGKTYVCYGISCKCEEYKDEKVSHFIDQV